jgi:hypothetical protein
MVPECHPIGTQCVEMGRANTGMAQSGERVATPLVYNNKQNVLLSAHSWRSSIVAAG